MFRLDGVPSAMPNSEPGNRILQNGRELGVLDHNLRL